MEVGGRAEWDGTKTCLCGAAGCGREGKGGTVVQPGGGTGKLPGVRVMVHGVEASR